jgi:hypothetical protein
VGLAVEMLVLLILAVLVLLGKEILAEQIAHLALDMELVAAGVQVRRAQQALVQMGALVVMGLQIQYQVRLLIMLAAVAADQITLLAVLVV